MILGVDRSPVEPTAELGVAEPTVPEPLLEATRALFWVKTPADARSVAAQLVTAFGGSIVLATSQDARTLPVDLSFGDGEPVLPAAVAASTARMLLERYLPSFVADAHRALEMNSQVDRLAEDASIDVLTKLSNRRMINRALGRLTMGDVVIMMDLDNFKQINDSVGHDAGDRVLRAFGHAIVSNLRGRDFAGRYGGEEFVIILMNPTDPIAFIERLDERWRALRPYSITFSAGIAVVGKEVSSALPAADHAMYRAKEAGRGGWMWATEGAGEEQSDVGAAPASHREGTSIALGLLSRQDPQPQVATPPPPVPKFPDRFSARAPDLSQQVGQFMDLARTGRGAQAVRLVLDLIDSGTPAAIVITDVLAPAQHLMGERWFENELSVADEHLASGAVESSLYAISSAEPAPEGRGSVLVASAEGDWHSLAALMIADLLQTEGFAVVCLGASTPAEQITRFLQRHRFDALAVSCNLPIFFAGVTRVADAAHQQGVPVLVGGRAFLGAPERAHLLGGDKYAETAADAAKVLDMWRESPPRFRTESAEIRNDVALLESDAAELARDSFGAFVDRIPPMASYPPHQLDCAVEDLEYIVRFVAAAQLVNDQSVFTEFLDWLVQLLRARSMPKAAVIAGLEALQPRLAQRDLAFGRLATIGLEHLSQSTGDH